MTISQIANRWRIAALVFAAITWLTPHQSLLAQINATDLEQQYQAVIQPLLKSFCIECHSDENAEAEVDLTVFPTTVEVRKQTKVWIKIRQMLDSEQMPPKDSKQPADDQRKKMQIWLHEILADEARSRAGDPGPVLLRRLSNAEYDYSIHDLTGISLLEPTAEFPIDSAAGEGFTNTGSGQGMSPALVQKYLDAAKQIANHAVLVPDGIGFSKYTTRRDRTDELLAEIRAFYRQFTDDGGGTELDLQGVRFNSNQDGRLPVEKYLTATLAERDALNQKTKTVADVAREYSLNEKYLARLWTELTTLPSQPSFLLDSLRAKWRQAKAGDAAALAAEMAQTQAALWKFNPVGHLGLDGGPTTWMEPVSPVVTRHNLRFKLPNAPAGSDVLIQLHVSDFGDGSQGDLAVWQQPRIEFPAEKNGLTQPVLLRDVQALSSRVKQTVISESTRTRQYLDALASLKSSPGSIDEIAKRNGLNVGLLHQWDRLIGINERIERQVSGRFPERLKRMADHEAINGWGSGLTPSLLTNRSDQPVTFLTLTIPAHGVSVHPSPALDSVVTWQCPVETQINLKGLVADADNKCGNGADWRLEMISEAGKSVLKQGTIDNGGEQRFEIDQPMDLKKGDLVSLIVSARNQDHSCDTTHLELTLAETGKPARVWDLATDIVDDVLISNPLPDSYGNPETWHFCAVPGDLPKASEIPTDSALARWRAAVLNSRSAGEIEDLAEAVEKVLTSKDATLLAKPDQTLRERLLDWRGPLGWIRVAEESLVNAETGYGVSPALFGKHPTGAKTDQADLWVKAPSVIEVRLPAELAVGAEFVASGLLDSESDGDGCVQFGVESQKTDSLVVSREMPVLVAPNGKARQRVEAAFDEFRELFPPKLCFTKLVPVDEVVTLRLFYRDDDCLQRLMLNESQVSDLDRLWDELNYVSQEPLQMVVAYEQLAEFATQDRPDLVKSLGPMQTLIADRAGAFERRLLETEPAHVDAVIEFADRAWRRPLSGLEQARLREFYDQLRAEEISHEQAVRLTLARVLTSPAFLYKLEQPVSTESSGPVSDLELATRMSYFLWSSVPDDELRAVAIEGKLTTDQELVEQAERMLDDPRIRRLAIQFACQWLHLRDFDRNDDKNEKRFPQFASLRGDMYEETVRFFEDMFRNDRSILELLDANHMFVNESLASHYGIDGVQGDQWRRVEGIRDTGRGGVLGMASFLASQSGASRTSPILRGNWIYETILGERLPRPPAGVPQLPDELPEGLTARQMIEHHSSNPGCAKCHDKIDPFGFALEQFDAIGGLRPQAVDTKTALEGGQRIDGIEGLREYLLNDRRGDVVRQFCRKLLGYSLGRELQLSDEPLLGKMVAELEKQDHRFSVAVKMIVTSRQFREIRGVREAAE